MSKTFYRDYIGNVTRENHYALHRTKVVWEKHKKYSEKQICKMLDEAYQLGRKEALEEVSEALEKVKK